MANKIAMIQIGITVLCRYPIPNGRNEPSLSYANAGFVEWKIKKRPKKRMIAKNTLFRIRNFFGNILKIFSIYNKIIFF